MSANKKIRLTEKETEALLKIAEQMQHEPGGQYSIKSVSKKIGINRHKLTYGFKQLTGYSLHQYLIHTRMENGKKLLIYTDKPIKEIAGVSGYKNTQNFLTAFKNFYKATASDIRKQYNK